MASIVTYKTKAGDTLYKVRYRKPETNRSTDKAGFKRKKDAQLWAAKNTVDISAGSYIDPENGKTTISDLYPTWMATKKISCKPSYIHSLEGSWNKWVEPQWGARAIGSIKKPQVQAWASKMATEEKTDGEILRKGKSASVVKRAVGILSGILDDAAEQYLIPRNPARGITMPKKVRKKHIYLTVEQLFTLAHECGKWEPVILVLGLVGMRWGELSDLHVGDVHMKRHRMTIWGSATQINGDVDVGTTKSGKYRSVIYPKALDGILRKQMKGKKKTDLLFTGTLDGHIRQPKNPGVGHSWFTAACDRAGLQRMTVHDLRHTAASLMVQSGANVKAVQHQLGHASAAMTLDIYADLFDDDLDSVGESMNQMVIENSVGFSWVSKLEKVA